MNLLGDVDVDEVSPVKRAANRRFVVLKEDEEYVDTELKDIMSVPWEREGALLDEIRKEINDETVERAIVAGVRLLKGIEAEFSPVLIEKLGAELYGRPNPKINTKGGESYGDLTGSSGAPEGSPAAGSDDGPDKDGEFDSDYELVEEGDTSPKVSADFSDDERKKLAANGQALEDGSYPIRNTGDLKNAIQAYGRASDKGRAKSWIIRRAKALGATGMLPDSWKVSKADETADNEEEMSVLDEGGTVEIQVPVRKEDGTWDLSGVPSEAKPFFEEMILKADETQRELSEAKERLAKADDEIRTRTMVEKAAAYSHVAPVDELAPVLKAAASTLDEETYGKLEAVLAGAEERISKGDLFAEAGRASRSDGTENQTAYAEAIKKADELVEKSDAPISRDQAISRVFEENPDLYSKYLAENGMGVS